MRCVNCGIALERLRRYLVSSLQVPSQAKLARWLPNQLQMDSLICHPCVILLNSGATERQRGHNMLCVACGRSVKERRHHYVETEDPLITVLSLTNIAHQLYNNERFYICRPCWQRGKRYLAQDTSRDRQESLPENNPPAQPSPSPALQPLPPPPPLPQQPAVSLPQCLPIPPQPSPPPPPPPSPPPPAVLQGSSANIRLPNYKRAANTSAHCIFTRCYNASLHLIPRFIKRHLLKDHNFYVPRSCRVCEHHLYENQWHLLPLISETFSSFNPGQLEDIIDILKSKTEIFDFEKVSEMPNHICHYWTGRTVPEFLALSTCIPMLNDRNPKRALAIYMIKLRTGENNRRLSSLFDIPRSTIQLIIKKVRKCLDQNFVAVNLGINLISHRQIADRNLRIPNGLFGNPEAAPENRPAIAIFDGTYIYLQKSSNYMFQKKSYSPHKYDNLVKPFLVVSTDGYIIDVVGPYAATQTDAEIMAHLFRDENSPYRRLFKENDVFILDRGFRDVIPLLESLNYKAYKPDSLEEGQTQLNYLQANNSRRVTLCRWVVEVVNGRFKRDYKLLRQRYFNKACKHLMTDFRIAAALINKFHPVLHDGPNAEQILQRAQRFMNEPNHLGQFINDYNLNRRRAMFSRIDGDLPQLHDFPYFTHDQLLLFSLGPYQVRQARSYFGEHIRENGMYEVEVCPELKHSQEMVFRVGGNNPYLLRGRIKSRHVSQRIYFSYILIDREPSSDSPLDAILGYYCSCIVGNRTVGCCCHVMTLVWYLGWARHQTTVSAPASFLDNILVTIDE